MLLRRAGADRTVLAVAALTLLLVAVAVAVLSLLLLAATDGTARTVLGHSDVAARTVVVTADLDDVPDLAAADGAVRSEVGAALDPAPVEVLRRSQSTSYALPDQPEGAVSRLTVLATYDELAARATLTAGAWPDAGAGARPLPVAVHDRAARALDIAPGSRLRLVNRIDDSAVRVRVVGTFTPRDPDGPGWTGDELGRRGVVRGDDYTTFGPIVVDPAALVRTADPTLVWVAQPDLSGLGAASTAATADGVRRLVEEGPSRLAGALGAPEVETELDDVLAAVATPVRVGRTAVAIPALLVALLAGVTLLVTGGLLGDHRAFRRSLWRARGASRAGLVAGDLAEAVLLAVPVVAVAPWLAALLVRRTDLLAGPGGHSLSPGPWTWGATGLVGLLGAAVLVVGAAAGSRPGRRSRRTGAVLRLVVEVGVVVLAVGAVAQLVRYRDVAGAGSDNDALIVVAPALVVLAAGLVGARVLPRVAGWGDLFVRHLRGASVPLGAWQLSRRAGEQQTALVLLLLAAAVAVFGAVHVASWTDSQSDQAAVDVGSDLRVSGLEDGRLAGVADLVTERGGAVADVRRLPARLGEQRVEALSVTSASAAEVLGVALPAGPGPLADASFTEGRGSAVPGVVAGSLGRDIDTSEGLQVDVAGTDVLVRVVGRLDVLPGGADPAAGGLLLARDQLAEAVPAVEEVAPEVWATLSPDRVTAVRDRIAAIAPRAQVTDRWSRARDARTAPVGAGTTVATWLSIGGAVLFAWTAFLAATSIGLRGRRTELAALRAVGLSTRQVVASVLWERVGLLALTMGAGGASGAVAAWFLVPALVRTPTGGAPVPPVDPTVPWPVILLGAIALAGAATLAVVVFLARSRRRALGGDLRMGEDT